LGFTQVAFAGHNRPGDLGDPAEVAAGLREATIMLSAAGISQARLLTGLAPGADLLAARAWRAARLGPVHGVFPFLDDKPPRGMARLVEQATWLDGASTREAGRNPYLTLTRWLIGAADLLVVVWTGKDARGAGGTADAVRLALEHRIPVLWIQPVKGSRLRLIRPEHLGEDFGFLEFLEEVRFARPPLVTPASPESLHAALSEIGLARTLTERDEATDRPRRPARAYRLFRRWLGGKASPAGPQPAPADLQAQPGFVGLSAAQVQADDRANRLGALHRSHQVILLGVAILAATAGSASALWPSLKVAMVAVELVLAVGALLIWRDSERERRHQRWGEARRLAEDLRLERAAWTLGVSTAPHGLNLTSTEAARHARRLAGLPAGAFDAARVSTWGRWAMAELVGGQAAYHRSQGAINARISHRVHQIENGSFAVLLATLVGYLATTGVMTLLGRETPHWLAGVVFMAGAIVPAIGAAGLALEATLSLGEEAQRSSTLAGHLETLAERLGPEPGLEAFQSIARSAIRLQRAQEDHWAEGSMRRRLVRGG
jgi:hypothetical protein